LEDFGRSKIYIIEHNPSWKENQRQKKESVWIRELQTLHPEGINKSLNLYGLHWPTVDEGLDTAALTSVSLMLLGRRKATTGGSGNNLASVSLFSISFQ
jgi:hypothetical protein